MTKVTPFNIFLYSSVRRNFLFLVTGDDNGEKGKRNTEDRRRPLEGNRKSRIKRMTIRLSRGRISDMRIFMENSRVPPRGWRTLEYRFPGNFNAQSVFQAGTLVRGNDKTTRRRRRADLRVINASFEIFIERCRVKKKNQPALSFLRDGEQRLHFHRRVFADPSGDIRNTAHLNRER